MPSTPATAPAMAGRTGSERSPVPLSNARPAPMRTGSGATRTSGRSNEGSRSWARWALREVAHSAVSTAATSTATATSIAPGARTTQSAWMPLSGSSRPAMPIGSRLDSAIAVTVPTNPLVAALRSRGRLRPDTRSGRVSPSARSALLASAMPYTVRVSAWPTRTTAARTTATAKRSRPVRSRSVAWVTRLLSSARFRTGMSGTRRSDAAWARKRSTSVPGASRTTRFGARGTSGWARRNAYGAT